MKNAWDEPHKAIEEIVDDRIVFYSANHRHTTVAVKGKVIFREKTDPFWAGDLCKDYQSEVLENPTWLDVAVAADEMIRTTGDHHHIFLESIHPVNEKIDGVTVYEFWMGS